VDNPKNPNLYLPSILTPTFGDWKLADQSSRRSEEKEHPKICRRNPFYDKFCLQQQKRELKSEGMVNKENFVMRTPINEENFSFIDKM
jgi:hypothetical protein